VAALLAYPVLGTLALWTGLVESMLRSEDLRVEIENPAYTIWPGRVHMKHVRVLHNSDVQFILEGKDLTAQIALLALAKRHFRVKKLAAHGVRYQMRTQVENEKGIEERIAAFPPLADLPGANVIREDKGKEKDAAEPGYTVEVEGLDVQVDELWFFEYRYLGDGRLRGGFVVGPQVMSVSTAVQDLGPGELRFGAEQVIATSVRGQITADIPRLNPEEHADIGFLELVTARTQLKADMKSMAHLGAYLQGIEVQEGSGPLSVDFYLEKGWLGPKSRLKYQTPTIGVRGLGYGVESDLHVDFDASGEKGPEQPLPLLRSSSETTYVSLSNGGPEFTLQIHGHHEEAALDRVRLTGSTQVKRAAVRMPSIVSVDLDDLEAALPKGTPLSASKGELRASVKLDMDEEYWVRGPIEANVEGADFELAGVHLFGHALVKAQAKLNPKLKNHMLDSVVLSLRNVGMRVGDEDVDSWWMDVTSRRLALWNTKPQLAQGTMLIRAKNLEPVLEALAEKDELNDLIAKFTSLDDFRARVTLRKQGETTDVALESESDVWDASGRFYSKGEQSMLAVVVGGQALSLGIAKLGGDLEIAPMAETEWLNARLRRFPKPLGQMAPEKP
jgi:hypothetical protein